MPERDLALLVEAATQAGEIARRYWRQDVKSWDKDDNAGPVSEADLAVNDHLRDRLLAVRPDYGWLSEESADDSARLDCTHCFIIDPIDGTRAFIAGEKSFSHSLAIARRGQIVAGVVYVPMLDLLYAAMEGGRSTLNGQVISPRITAIGDADVLTGKAALNPALWRDGVPPFRRSLRPSLAWRLCLVAEGRFDATLSLTPAWEWDIAAGSLIAQQAGASVTDRHGAPMQFNNPHPRIDGLVIAAPGLHHDITSRLAPSSESQPLN